MFKLLRQHLQRILFLFFTLCSFNESLGQCNPPYQLPTPLCEDAPLVCLLNACYGTFNIPNTGPTGWCNGNNTIENPQFFQFIATANNVSIHIYVEGCAMSTNASLQAGIINACPWDTPNVLACNGGTVAGGTIYLTTNQVQAGEVYWLMLDGSSGAFCFYTITYIENIFTPLFEEELTSGEAIPADICLGSDELTLAVYPPIDYAHGYYWILGWSGDTVLSTISTTTISVPSNISEGTYEICAGAFSGCDTSDNDICFEVNVVETFSGVKDPVILCPEEFPVSLGSLTITQAGEYEAHFTAYGCDFDSTWVVESYPQSDFVIIDTIHCLEPGSYTFYYDNQPFDNSGTFPLFYPNADVNGCDSMAELNLLMIGVEANVEITCDNGGFVFTANIVEVIPFNAEVEFYWFEQGQNIQVGQGNPFMTHMQGCYDLFINVITTEGSCESFIQNVCNTGDDYFPPPPEIIITDTLICSQNTIFCVMPDPSGDTIEEYFWTAPSNVLILQNGSECVEMDFSNSQGGSICVSAIGDCGSGPPRCFNINVMPSSIASFISDSSLCKDEITTVTFTGTASINAQVIWDFNTPSSITGSGLGPYQVAWSNPGTKTIKLTVIEPGCDTASTTVDIEVELLTTPVINCTSTISSIDFDWTDVSGSNGYLVSFNGGPAVPVMDSDTLLSGLTPGTMVELIVTTVSPGPCPNTMDTMVCTAENCPPPSIELTGEDSVCLNVPAIVDLEDIVNGSPGTGTWSGPGIIDMNEGLFDPKIAGPGQHQLTYTVLENGCPFNQPFTIAVFDSITADFLLDPLICISDVANVQYLGNASGSAEFEYNFGTATIEAGSGVGPYQLRWDTPGQKTVRLQIEENGCVSDNIAQTTDVVAELVAPVVPCSQNTSSVTFSWTIDPAATDSVINVLSGQSGTLNGSTYNFGGLVPGDTVTIEIISLTNGPCPARRDTFECEARLCPPVELNIAPVDDICLYPATGLVDLEVAITNGMGAGEWMGAGVTDVINGEFDPAMAGSGAHLITYHYIDDGCDFLETITINVYDIPEAFISNNNPIITCTSASVFLDGSSSSGTPLTYEWTTVDGSIVSGANTPIAEAVKPGVYQLLVTNANGCKDSVSVTVGQDSNIPVADAGPDKTITCDTIQFTLGGNSTTGVNVIYLWSTTDGNIIGPVNAINTEANRTGDYTIIVRDTVTGCQSQDNALISIDTAVASITLTPGDTIDCNSAFSTVSSLLSEPANNYLFSWSTADGFISGASDGEQIEVSQGGTYTLTIQSLRNGCETSAAAVVAESDEIIDAVDVAQKNVTCFGDDDGELSVVDVEGGTPGFSYNWLPAVGSGTMITSLSPGSYSLTVTDANGCTYTQVYTITEPELVTVDLGSALTVKEGDSVRITLSTNLSGDAIGSIDWAEYSGVACPGCTTFEFIAASGATITAIITDTAGCSAIDSVRLTVVVPRIIYIPNIFSPNNDDINDYFTISGRHNLNKIKSFRIYDRWGNQLFEGVNMDPGIPELGWDGTFRDKPMQPGVYVFIAELEYDDLTETISGNFTLVR